MDLLTLQANIKRDCEGYRDDFLLQYRHYQALLEVFNLKPSKECKEFGELATFIAQVAGSYLRTTAQFAPGLMQLLDTHYAVLDPHLRRTLVQVQSLILMRNRGLLQPIQVLPLFFRLFRCQDKSLRRLLFGHIVADIKNSNKKHRNEKLNRQLQSFMYGIIADDNEAAAKKSLAVCTELWRRQVWRDARTVNVIASAAFHKSSRVMLAAVKFFLGQDKDGDEDGEKDERHGPGSDDENSKVRAPSKEDVYKAYNAGTRSSKRKKVKKLKRVMATVKKVGRREAAATHETFAALHLLHDPQAFAERLFTRLQSGNERFEARMAMLGVVSRIIGMHKLQVLNFYPFLQKYVAPHTRDITVILAALVGAAHDLVPPEVLAPVLRQLVDQFVHDRARPEMMTVGLKTVRELCLRCPLIMTEELLQDLVAYKKYKDKQVVNAARALISLYRELQPELLAKKDRGRGADLASRPRAYGEASVAERVDGAALLEEALAAGQGASDDEVHFSDSDSSDGDDDGDDAELESMSGSEAEDEPGGTNGSEKAAKKKGLCKALLEKAAAEGSAEEGSSDSEDVSDMSDDEGGSGSDSQEDSEGAGSDKEGEVDSSSGSWEEVDGSSQEASSGEEGSEEDDEEREGQQQPAAKKARLEPQEDSIAALKRKLLLAKQQKDVATEAEAAAAAAAASGVAEGSGQRIEAERFLTAEDFERIKRLKHKRLVEAALAKHGLKSMSKAKRNRLLLAAEEEAEEAAALERRRAHLNEAKVTAGSLEGKRKRAHDKEARLASVMAGREGRDKFGSSSAAKKAKTGGLSERQKQRKKDMPLAARFSQLQRRADTAKRNYSKKNFKGHVRGGGRT
ncbi:SDA1-domain-containing protein [Haematococcus lacustris]